MTLPTKDEAKRAAETLIATTPTMSTVGEMQDRAHAITLLRAYAEGLLVAREELPEPWTDCEQNLPTDPDADDLCGDWDCRRCKKFYDTEDEV